MNPVTALIAVSVSGQAFVLAAVAMNAALYQQSYQLAEKSIERYFKILSGK